MTAADFVCLSFTTVSLEGLLNKFLTVTGVRGETPQETGAHERPYLSLANAHNQCVQSVILSHTMCFLFHLHPDSEWQIHCLCYRTGVKIVPITKNVSSF